MLGSIPWDTVLTVLKWGLGGLLFLFVASIASDLGTVKGQLHEISEHLKDIRNEMDRGADELRGISATLEDIRYNAGPKSDWPPLDG